MLQNTGEETGPWDPSFIARKNVIQIIIDKVDKTVRCDSVVLKKPILDIEIKMGRKNKINIPCKHQPREQWYCHISLRLKQTSEKAMALVIKGALCNDKGVHPLRRPQNSKHVCTLQQNFKLHKAEANHIKREINKSAILIGDFNGLLSTINK